MAKKSRSRPRLSGVASADRLLLVLTAFESGDRTVELAELAARTGLVKSTIMRLAISLEKFGLIERRSDGSYQLGAETKRLGLVYEQAFDLERAITPVLEELSQRTEETASFYVPHAKRRLCLYRVESPQRLRVHVRPGDLRPMDHSAIARVLRAFGSSTQTASPPNIQVPLYSSGATDPHVAALAMPVFGEEGALLGAVALSGPVTRFTQERAEAVADLLCSAAIQITKSIGGRLEIPQATSTEAA